MISGLPKVLSVSAAVFVLLSGVAFTHPHVDCDMVRSQVREHGIVKAYAWALANGYTPSDIRRIRKVCGV